MVSLIEQGSKVLLLQEVIGQLSSMESKQKSSPEVEIAVN